MRIVQAFPPNYSAILAAFPFAATMKPIFAYGDAIYNPHGVAISDHLKRHEAVHLKRQYPMPARWWNDYIFDKEFRLHEEVLAHAAEYESMCENLTRNQRRIVFRGIAGKLASRLYGPLCSIDEAKRLIRVNVGE